MWVRKGAAVDQIIPTRFAYPKVQTQPLHTPHDAALRPAPFAAVQCVARRRVGLLWPASHAVVDLGSWWYHANNAERALEMPKIPIRGLVLFFR